MGDSNPRGFYPNTLSAYDHPARWEGVTAEALLQRLAECVQEAEERGSLIDWPGVVERMVAWRDDRGSASAAVGQSVVLLEPPGNWGVVHVAGRRYPDALAGNWPYLVPKDGGAIQPDLEYRDAALGQ